MPRTPTAPRSVPISCGSSDCSRCGCRSTGSAEAVLDSSFPSVPERSTESDIAAIAEQIAGVVGAWCPSLSPDGHRIAYVTDRSRLPRLEVAHLHASGEHADAIPRPVSLPHQEVVSVAWSP